MCLPKSRLSPSLMSDCSYQECCTLTPLGAGVPKTTHRVFIWWFARGRKSRTGIVSSMETIGSTSEERAELLTSSSGLRKNLPEIVGPSPVQTRYSICRVAKQGDRMYADGIGRSFW